MKYTFAMALVLSAALLGISPPTAQAEEAPAPQVETQPAPEPAPAPLPGIHPPGYMILKAGVYLPSEKFDLSNVKLGSPERLNPKDGFDGELALGAYLLPILAMELDAGYFHSKATADNGGTKMDVVPVLATVKLLIPIGPLEPYAEGGGGAYITNIKGTGDFDNFKLTTKCTWGVHAGIGANLFLSRHFFIGAEGRYIWAGRPKFGGEDVKLNGFTVTGDLGVCF